MSKSILHNKDDKTCYLCMLLKNDYSEKTGLQEHHIFFGSANRKISEKYGLKVYLCLWHHTEGKEAVHKNTEYDTLIKQTAQKAFIKKYSAELFTEKFKKNYLDMPIKEYTGSKDVEKDNAAAGMMFIE